MVAFTRVTKAREGGYKQDGNLLFVGIEKIRLTVRVTTRAGIKVGYIDLEFYAWN